MKNKQTHFSAGSVWRSPLFIAALALKLFFSFVFASRYLTDLFVPFINWFVLSGFKNPWEFFFSLGRLNMFPYPTVMLGIMSAARLVFSPFLAGGWETVTPVHLFVFRLPLLAFDLLLFLLLLKRFPVHPEKVTLIYWCSPIVFFINYVHGQFDIIPTALFFLALDLLTDRRNLRALAVLAVAAAAKNHILIAAPFVFTFLYKERLPVRRLILYFLFFSGLYSLLLAPYAASEAFREMVFNSPEQKKFFDFALPVSPQLSIMVCPTVIALLFMKFVSYRKLNREILFMFLGIVFACFVIFVPPMPGWFLWSLPFLIYFYISTKDYSRAPFIIYNAMYLFYFIFFFGRDPFFSLPGRDPGLAGNLALSLLMSTVGFIALWMFKLGTERNELLRRLEAPLLIGIGGDSGSGKHTLLNSLRILFGKDKSIPILGDNFHKWERGHENWKVYSHLHPSGNKLHREVDVAVALKDGRAIEIGHYDHATGKFTDPKTVEPSRFIFFVGLHPFYLKKMRELIQIKIFMDTEDSLRRFWKIRRDMSKRGYSREKVLEQIEARSEDSTKYIQPQAQYADLVVRMSAAGDIDPERTDAAVPLKTQYGMDNSIDLDPLLTQLQAVQSLTVTLTHGLERQELEVAGDITAREVMKAAYNLNFNFDELMVRTNRWARGMKGIHQLVFLVLYQHKMKAR